MRHKTSLSKSQTGFLVLAAAGAALFGAVGCATSTLTIESSAPQAEVSLLGEGAKGTKQSLGKTPLSVPLSTFPRDAASVIEIEAPGHFSKRIVLPALSQGQTRMFVGLEKVDEAWFLKQMRGGFSGALSEALGDLLVLNTAILSRDAAGVKKWLAEEGPRYGAVAAFHVLMGHHHLVEGRLEEASAAYRKALDLDPKNEDALAALDSLQPRGK